MMPYIKLLYLGNKMEDKTCLSRKKNISLQMIMDCSIGM